MKKLMLILLFLLSSALLAFSSSELNGTGIHYRIYADGAEVTSGGLGPKFLNPYRTKTITLDVDVNALTVVFDTLSSSSTASASYAGTIPIPGGIGGDRSIPFTLTIDSASYELHSTTALPIDPYSLFFTGQFNGEATINIQGSVDIGGSSYPFTYIPAGGATNVNFCQRPGHIDDTNYPGTLQVSLLVSGRAESNQTILSETVSGYGIEIVATAGTAWFFYDVIIASP